jgi:hypothetical protein
MSGAVGMLTMRRLQAPARHKPGIEQHQRRALWPHLRETASYLQNRAAGKPLCGRFGAGQSLPHGLTTGCVCRDTHTHITTYGLPDLGFTSSRPSCHLNRARGEGLREEGAAPSPCSRR